MAADNGAGGASGAAGAAGAAGAGTAGAGGLSGAGGTGGAGGTAGSGGADAGEPDGAIADGAAGGALDGGDGWISVDVRDAPSDHANRDTPPDACPPTGCPCPLCGLVPKCSEVSVTTVSGKVFTARAVGADPVPRAVVYIPNIALGAKLGPIQSGATCDRCDPLSPSVALVSATSAPDGSFQLQGNIPAGVGIPLVVQLGKWRYETTIDVLPCVSNPIPDGVARLPRTQAEGNIPLTAISTGNHDALECILRKMGVADSEFSNPSSGVQGRLHFFRNNGVRYDAATPNQAALVGNAAVMDSYDQILFPCEGARTEESPGAQQNFLDYANKGGRAFATHFSYTWLYMNGGFATAGLWQVDQQAPPSPLIGNVDTTAQSGRDFAKWLEVVGALSNLNPPQVSINDPHRNLNAVPPMQGGQQWIASTNPVIVQHMSVAAPVNAPPYSQCGRVIYSDFHVANADNGTLTFPNECLTDALTAQEKILEFILLDLAACF
jgi:hypothetical protein